MRLHELDSAEAFEAAGSGWYTDPKTGVTEIKTPSVSTGHAFSLTLRRR